MKWTALVLSVIISFSALGNVRDSVARETRKVQREKLKIERQRKRIERHWDQRTIQQRKTDRRILIILAIASGILVNNVAHKE